MKFLSKIFLFYLVLFSCNTSSASSNPPQPLGPLPPPPLPIDGSLLFLVAFAILIAIYKTYWKTNKTT
jgi:hypothetical protein